MQNVTAKSCCNVLPYLSLYLVQLYGQLPVAALLSEPLIYRIKGLTGLFARCRGKPLRLTFCLEQDFLDWFDVGIY